MQAYDTALAHAYHTPLDWRKAKLHGARTYAQHMVPRINMGVGTGKTTSAVDWANVHADTLIVCATAAQAARISSRFSVRAYGPDHFKSLKSDHFTNTDPMFIFDDVPWDVTLDIVTQFQPTRAIHIGVTG